MGMFYGALYVLWSALTGRPTPECSASSMVERYNYFTNKTKLVVYPYPLHAEWKARVLDAAKDVLVIRKIYFLEITRSDLTAWSV